MRPYRKFNDWMHMYKKLTNDARDPNKDYILLIIIILLEIFVFLIEWRFKQSIESYQGD